MSVFKPIWDERSAFTLEGVRFYWPLHAQYVTISTRNGSSTKVLDIGEAFQLFLDLTA